MSEMTLVKPALKWKDAYINYYKEWLESGETMIPWVIEKDPYAFDEMIEFLENNERGVYLPPGWVPDTTYWMMDKQERIIGVTNIRHKLTDRLRKEGGHIGYGIRPSERRNGYATTLLRLSLEKAWEMKITDVLVVCDQWNTGSWKAILKNGGKEDQDFVEEDGNVVKRFWISRK
ncbi:GNAT family N-acetyltransferase [Bacillus sp. SB49]|uniref:GNAT family N-acetyltransferase n=2 Tax=Bacillaceae TaxID=186817 RepID=UPI000415EA3F|nr:GNAT family N-acetyltransferase [Bacillus sp. SB49]QHT46972.1 GNAT family N-acetyltransferase [Bacillus sp. SB49]